MEELKPCPFCGGEAVRMNFLDNPPFPNMRGTRYIGCRKCCVVSFTGMTDAEAVEAWNTRAERTCKIENAGEVPDNIIQSEEVWFCSECGSPIYNDITPSYCIYCGAKVVD